MKKIILEEFSGQTNFNEKLYLAANPDILKEIERGEYSSAIGGAS